MEIAGPLIPRRNECSKPVGTQREFVHVFGVKLGFFAHELAQHFVGQPLVKADVDARNYKMLDSSSRMIAPKNFGRHVNCKI